MVLITAMRANDSHDPIDPNDSHMYVFMLALCGFDVRIVSMRVIFVYVSSTRLYAFFPNLFPVTSLGVR